VLDPQEHSQAALVAAGYIMFLPLAVWPAALGPDIVVLSGRTSAANNGHRLISKKHKKIIQEPWLKYVKPVQMHASSTTDRQTVDMYRQEG
jgi:hypothetical protein